ncbi:MAG: ssl1498 family light-harvesting-like protein [Chamaesiphon sp.]|nr:ssl1498 family light-harvesting-like protein [Chamaesiphon sp.]
MPYINNDGDTRMNNFPTEPKMYVDEATDADGKQNYLIVGIVGVVLVAALTFVAMAVS